MDKKYKVFFLLLLASGALTIYGFYRLRNQIEDNYLSESFEKDKLKNKSHIQAKNLTNMMIAPLTSTNHTKDSHLKESFEKDELKNKSHIQAKNLTDTWIGPSTSKDDCPNILDNKASSQTAACVIPEIDPFHPSIMKYIRKVADPNCHGVSYGTLVNGTLTLTDKVTSAVYRAIVRSGDFRFILGKVTPVNRTHKIPHELIEVHYTLTNNRVVKDYLYQVIPRKDLKDRRGSKEPGLPYNILAIGIDSLSHGNTLRSLPRLYKRLVDDPGAVIFPGHAVVGDGTTPQLTAMLTGKHVEEQYEARTGVKNAKELDDWSWIFPTLKDYGYLTGMSEDGVHEGPFQYRLKGFKLPPTDFYPRPIFLDTVKLGKTGRDRCINNRNIAQFHLDYIKHVFDAYPNNLKFFLSFNAAFSHHEINDARKNEPAMLNLIDYLQDKGYLNNTILIVMGDHGLRFGPVRSLVQGKLEERLPLFSMLMPQSFRHKYPQLMATLRNNTHRLTSWFDVHATLHHLLTYPNPPPANLLRGLSLFTPIPADRTCLNAGVTSHWCPCLEWVTVPAQYSHVVKAAETAVQYMNTLLRGEHDSAEKCRNLSLETVNFAQMERPSKELAKTAGQSREYFCRYQFQFVTSPNLGVYEATVKVHNTRFILSTSISRINKYGDQPACVTEKHPYLRKFCLCNTYNGPL